MPTVAVETTALAVAARELKIAMPPPTDIPRANTGAIAILNDS
jgi:hypothetical protein